FDVTVQEKNSLPMTYTLAIVDEGLLDLTAFKTPNPWNSFYQKEALGVRSWDMYDWVMNSYAGSMAPLLSIGGDEELRNTSRNKANRFKPVVMYAGPFYLAKGKIAKHQLKLPEYVGAVRVMVVAGNQEGAYGNVSRSVEVKNRIMTLSSLPRVLAPGDEIYLPVNLFVTDKIIKQASVSVTTANNLLTVVGNNQQKVDVKAPEDKVLFFKLKAGNKTGKEVITIRSFGSNDTFTETIEIDVRNANLPVTQTQNVLLNSGESKQMLWNIPQQAANKQVNLTASAFPAINLTARLNYLLQYPYGCTEQIISQAFPQLYLTQLVALGKDQQQAIKTSVRQTIDKLYTLQNANGGIAYWQGLKESNLWVSSYALSFVSEAGMKGYNINPEFMSKLITYQRNQVRLWADANNLDMMPSQMQEAFRLYSLALANKPDLGAMNRMREMSNLHAEAKWTLANTYTLVNKSDIATELISGIEGLANRSSGFDSDFGSQLRDQSIALMTLLHLNKLNDAMSYVQTIAQQLSSSQTYSTQSTAFALMAMSEAAQKMGKGGMDFEWNQDKGAMKPVESDLPIWEQQLTNIKNQGEVTIRSKQKGTLFAELNSTYTPLFDQSPAVSKGISMQIKYVGQNGAPLNTKELMQGTSFTMIVEVSNLSSNQDYTNLALSQILPGGWEILSTRYAGISEGMKNFTYQDIRDDRMLTFFDLNKGEKKQFYCRVQASYAGIYYMPATVCEAMYDADVYARSTASEIKIMQE
ncbi:MAG: alpha-2-macroglobulin family protein, partial [Bacteroidales bacterium]